MNKNSLRTEDRAIHSWYRFVLAYPPHLVREYLEKFRADPERDWVFDPFSGTATTPLEARLNGFSVIGTDANPVAVLANQVKLNWEIDLELVKAQLEDVVQTATDAMRTVGLEPAFQREQQLALFDDVSSPNTLFGLIADRRNDNNGDFDPDKLLDENAQKVLPTGFISPLPLKRVLAIRYAIEKYIAYPEVRDFFRLALANTILSTAGNVAFGPEIYATRPKEDAPVLLTFYETVHRMIGHVRELVSNQTMTGPSFYVARDDARKLAVLADLPPIGVVITSPPYPNEKDYTRTTRLENVLLGYIQSPHDLRDLKERLLRSNTRNVFVNDHDDQYIRDIPAIIHLAQKIENRRLELGKTSGFEKLYHRVTTLYFGGMYRHLQQLFPRLRPGGRCAYVVGDQMSFFRILIPTAHLLADVALKVGYQVEGIEIWRNRFSTTTHKNIEKNVLILKKPE
ncbi:MAG: site-specific DNA-methyltransferase [Anaerolineae bacterium]|nr:MAG: site-specific DNA-methyltransferase [Anaerolineae bacterium]